MQLWKACEEVKLNEYLEARGLGRNALFAQLLQALIELSAAGSQECSILESLSNHDEIEKLKSLTQGPRRPAHVFTSCPKSREILRTTGNSTTRS
jgi:hypothetical protein